MQWCIWLSRLKNLIFWHTPTLSELLQKLKYICLIFEQHEVQGGLSAESVTYQIDELMSTAQGSNSLARAISEVP